MVGLTLASYRTCDWGVLPDLETIFIPWDSSLPRAAGSRLNGAENINYCCSRGRRHLCMNDHNHQRTPVPLMTAAPVCAQINFLDGAGLRWGLTHLYIRQQQPSFEERFSKLAAVNLQIKAHCSDVQQACGRKSGRAWGIVQHAVKHIVAPSCRAAAVNLWPW